MIPCFQVTYQDAPRPCSYHDTWSETHTRLNHVYGAGAWVYQGQLEDPRSQIIIWRRVNGDMIDEKPIAAIDRVLRGVDKTSDLDREQNPCEPDSATGAPARSDAMGMSASGFPAIPTPHIMAAHPLHLAPPIPGPPVAYTEEARALQLLDRLEAERAARADDYEPHPLRIDGMPLRNGDLGLPPMETMRRLDIWKVLAAGVKIEIGQVVSEDQAEATAESLERLVQAIHKRWPKFPGLA